MCGLQYQEDCGMSKSLLSFEIEDKRHSQIVSAAVNDRLASFV
jgi:hypothetical protein